jgi:hypothetical protein
MCKNIDTELFNKDFLFALSNWQKGWQEDQEKRKILADDLVKACEHLPNRFKVCDQACYRKRFIVKGEMIPIVWNDEYFEGVASWTKDINFAKGFKGLLKPSTEFAMIFKKFPRQEDVILNIPELWKSSEFQAAVDNLSLEMPEVAYPLINFKDSQSEIILRSVLKGSEIEHIVGISSSFDDLCDKAGIPVDERTELSKQFALKGIDIYIPVYASEVASRNAVKRTIARMKALFATSEM